MPYVDPTALAESVLGAISRNPINIMRMMSGASQGVFEGFGIFSRAFYGPASSLPANLREIAILRVGYMCGAAYETFQHEPAARQSGVSDNQIEALKSGGGHSEAFDEIQQAVVIFTEDVVTNVKAGDDSLAAVRKHLTDRQVLDLTLLIGLYMMVSRFLETTGVELDSKTIDWKRAASQH